MENNSNVIEIDEPYTEEPNYDKQFKKYYQKCKNSTREE